VIVSMVNGAPVDSMTAARVSVMALFFSFSMMVMKRCDDA